MIGQVDGQVARRDVGPVHVLEHQEHGVGDCAFLEQRQHALEYSQLGTDPGLAGFPPRLAPRAEGFDERVEGELGPCEVEGVPEKHHETRRAGALRKLRDEARLAHPGIATDQDGRAAP